MRSPFLKKKLKVRLHLNITPNKCFSDTQHLEKHLISYIHNQEQLGYNNFQRSTLKYQHSPYTFNLTENFEYIRIL